MAQQDEYKPINTGDGVTLKAQLDDNIIKVLGETGFTEDHFWSNVKLLLLSGASIVALVAQFYPMPFPDSRTLLAVCCVLYLVFNVVLQVITWFVEQDKIAVMRTKVGADELRLVVRTSLPRFNHMYTVQLEDAATGKQLAKLEKSVGCYYTEEGEYAHELFEADVNRCVAQAQSDWGKKHK